MFSDRDGILRFRSLADAFSAVAFERADATLLSYEGKAWSYRDIDSWSNSIALDVLAKFGPEKTVLGVMSEDLPLVLASYLGILKAGCAYAGLDPGLPDVRLAALKSVAGISGCIADEPHLSKAAMLMTSPDGVLVARPPERAGDAGAPGIDIRGSDICHILFTSGSTGKPKAVPRSHEDQLHNAERHRALALGPGDKVTLISRRGFFDSVSNPFAAMLSGATICAIRLLTGAEELGQWIERERLTVYYSFPTIFRQLLATNPPADALASLRLVYLGGEAVHRDDLQRACQLLQADAQIAVGLGSTETGVTAIKLYPVRDGAPEVVSVGRARDGVRIEIWNDEKAPVGPMEVGTIVFRSRFIFHGYRGVEGHSDGTVYPDPGAPGSYIFESSDRGYLDRAGELVITGRRDDLVKLRGFRIELGEVEAALQHHPEVRQASALLTSPTGSPQDDELVAFVSTRRPSSAEDGIKQWLARTLPDHMIPTRILVVDEFPYTPNGKIDRRGLATLYASIRKTELETRPQADPQGALEAKVAALWSLLLKKDRISRNDSFHALGGNSLNALVFVSLLKKELGKDIPLLFLFEDDRLCSFCDRCAAYLASN
jgi:peptide synthetase PhsA